MTDAGIRYEQRADRGALLRSHVRDDGTLLVEGYAAREGVLEYRAADGSVWRELVTPEAIRTGAATLGRAPVTLQHPAEDVTPETYQRDAVGDVDGEVAVEAGGFVRVRLAVRRADAIAAIRSGVQELSAGYRARIDPTPGEHPEYGRYDARQIERATNHLAIVDVARAGPEVRLRADATATTLIDRPRADGGTMHPRLVLLLSLLGVTQRLDTTDAGLEAAIDAARKRKDAEEAMAAEESSEVTTLTAALDAAKAALAKLQTAYDELEATNAEAADKQDRADLAPLCTRLGVDPAKHPATPDLRKALAAAHLGGKLAREDAAYVDAVVDLARAGTTERSDGRAAGNAAWNGGGAVEARADTQARRPSARDRYYASLGLGPKATT